MEAFPVTNTGKVLSRVITKSVAYIFFGRRKGTLWPFSKSKMSFYAIPCYGQRKSFK